MFDLKPHTMLLYAYSAIVYVFDLMTHTNC